MKLFKLDEQYSIICESKNTKNGFKHVATLLYNGYEREKTKICYLNRTWEVFEFESVLLKMIDLYFENNENQQYKNIIKNL